MSVDTQELTEDMFLEQEEFLDNFSVENLYSIDNEKNIENNLELKDDKELTEDKDVKSNFGQFVLEMRGGQPGDWRLTYQETGSKFDGKELFGQDGTSLTEIIRNSDLTVDKILGHEDMLNHFRDNVSEPYLLPDWIEQGTDGEQIIHVTVASIDKEGNVSYETWTYQKEKPKEEEEDKKKDKNNNNEEKQVIEINKIEKNFLLQDKKEEKIVFKTNNYINNNENLILNKDNELLDNKFIRDNIYSSLEINIYNNETTKGNNLFTFDSNKSISRIDSISQDVINVINNKENNSVSLQKNEVYYSKDTDKITNNDQKINKIDIIKVEEIINEFEEKIEEVNIINNTKIKDFTSEEIISQEVNEIKEVDTEMSDNNEINIINHTKDKDNLENINIINNTEIRNSILENTILNEEEHSIFKFNEEIKEIIIEDQKKSEFSSFENTVEISKEVTPDISNSKEKIININNTKKSIDNVKVNNEEMNKKEIVQEIKMKTLEERILNLFKDQKIDVFKEIKSKKQDTSKKEELKNENNIVTKNFSSKEVDTGNIVSSDKKELKIEINSKNNINEKEILINKPIVNEFRNNKSSKFSKDIISINTLNEKLLKDNSKENKEIKVSGREILMRTLGLSSKINNEGFNVLYSNINQYQKEEEDVKSISLSRFSYKPSNINGISLKIRA